MKLYRHIVINRILTLEQLRFTGSTDHDWKV
jgi:hypothetical protein